MDALSGQFPRKSLEPGTHVLGMSLPRRRGATLTDLYVATGLDAGEDCIVITTDRDALAVVESLSALLADPPFENLFVVDATGQEFDALPCHHEAIGSPGDLTGLGIAFTKALDALDPAPGEFRVTVDSVSSLIVHAGFDRVYQFLHMIVNRVDNAEGTLLSTLTASTDSGETEQFEGLIDGVIDLREHEDALQYRLRGSAETSPWQSIDEAVTDEDIVTVPQSEGMASSEETASSEGMASTAGDAVPSAETVEPPTSLQDFLETVAARRLDLTICNPESMPIDEDLVAYFDRLNVSVRTADLSRETPRGVAILHRAEDPIAMSALRELQDAIELESLDHLTDRERPAVLRYAHRNEFSVEHGSRVELLRISRLIEGRALAAGRGAIHTGLQRLDRIEDEAGTRKYYEAITGTDVTVHLYGAPGEVPDRAADVIHAAEDGELLESWFVVFDGGGDRSRMAALVCREVEPGRYSGIWTYRPADVDAVLSYLETTYVDD
ncbi:MAG: DUF7504 family protein [Halococcoides sp.]